MHSIVRRDTKETYQEFLTRLAKASGIETPIREDLARIDKSRKNKASNKEWDHPHDPDARVTTMKDGTTHLAHKVEHVAVGIGKARRRSVQGCTPTDGISVVGVASVCCVIVGSIRSGRSHMPTSRVACGGFAYVVGGTS